MFSILSKIKMLNNECENALIDFPFHDNSSTWISDHQTLFDRCSNIIEDPNIESTQAAHCVYIHKFDTLYKMHDKK